MLPSDQPPEPLENQRIRRDLNSQPCLSRAFALPLSYGPMWNPGTQLPLVGAGQNFPFCYLQLENQFISNDPLGESYPFPASFPSIYAGLHNMPPFKVTRLFIVILFLPAVLVVVLPADDLHSMHSSPLKTVMITP